MVLKNPILLDTNVLVRFLTKDHPDLFQRAKSLLEEGEQGNKTFYIHDVILAETIWILSKIYEYPRQKIAHSLEKLLSQEWMINENKTIIFQALTLYETSSLSFPDCLLYSFMKSKGYEIEIFDEKLKRFRFS